MDNLNWNQGAPIIRNEGVVLNDNGQLPLLNSPTKMARLKNIVNQSLKTLKNPVLAREIVSELSSKDL